MSPTLLKVSLIGILNYFSFVKTPALPDVTTPPPVLAPVIDPVSWTGGPGVVIRLTCTSTTLDARISWSKSESRQLPVSAVVQDGVLTINNPIGSDSGVYVCTATYQGVTTTNSAIVSIQTTSRPKTRVEPERQLVPQGTPVEVKCIVTGDPAAVVTWTKRRDPLESHIQVIGNTLRIANPSISDRGIYVCRAIGIGGASESSAVIDVSRK